MGEVVNGWEKVGRWRIDVSQGYETPWGYGLAYWRWDCNKAVCYPLGINWLVWICREIYFRIKFTPRGIEHSSYTKGKEMGYSYGFEHGEAWYFDNIIMPYIKNEKIPTELKDKLTAGLWSKIKEQQNENSSSL